MLEHKSVLVSEGPARDECQWQVCHLDLLAFVWALQALFSM